MPPRIAIVTPFPVESQMGNSVSACRIAERLGRYGWDTRVTELEPDNSCEALIAVHAIRSVDAIRSYQQQGKPIAIVLAGSDLYDHKAPTERAVCAETTALANALVVAQAGSLAEVAEKWQAKTRVIQKSVALPDDLPAVSFPKDDFRVVLFANLRVQKRPYLIAEAAMLLPSSSRVKVDHYGSEIDASSGEKVQALMAQCSRYFWHGEIPHADVLAELRQAHLATNTSLFEGGANAICEAIACGTPMVAAANAGNVGVLGENYPGLFEVDDARGLADLLLRCERDEEFLSRLRSETEALAADLAPENEAEAWDRLMRELVKDTPYKP